MATLISTLVMAVANGLGLALLRVPLRRLLRYEVAVAVAFAALVSLENALALGGPFWLMLPLVMAVDGVPIYLIVRWGVLPSIVALFTTSMLLSFPAGPTLGHWSANSMLIGLAIAAAILAYGYVRSQGGHSRLTPMGVRDPS